MKVRPTSRQSHGRDTEKGKRRTVGTTSYMAAYADASDVSGWAQTAMRWANANGLITGRTMSTLAPLDNATRAEASTILQRFIERLIAV